MKKFLLSVVLATALLFSSCTSEMFDDSAIWDKFNEVEESIRDHEERISALEELCKQMNTNISALQTIIDALEKRDHITNVSPIEKDGEIIGYTITFAKSGSVTIYHGQDGKDGANGADGKDGKDGYTPQIGVKQDTDGIYYWTVDGEWLLDAQGNKVKAVGIDGKDGQDGTNGSNGQDGKDGVTPQLKIENDYWYISYDNGATWQQLGKAMGEDGESGKDGDSFFQSVTQDDEFVYFTLADGTVITLAKYKGETASDNCKIYYTTSDGKKMFPYSSGGATFGAILVSNTYKDGKGVLVFDDTVTLIGDDAFKSCTALTNITIPDSVTSIGSSAFSGCSSLTSITIPDSVTSIGERAFEGCTGELIVNCNIPSASSYGYGAFYGSKFTKVIIGNGVTSIGEYAFAWCSSLTSVTIGNSVTSIGILAFSNDWSLTSVTIPDSVTSIGVGAFHDCSSLKAFYGKLASSDNRCLIVDGVLNSFAPAGLTEYTIPDSVTSIGILAFFYCTSLTSVTIPDSVTEIGNDAFDNCSSLTSVTIPDSVTSIGDWAFYECSSLTSVTIGNSVTSIGYYAFCDCSSLTSVYCKPTTPPTGGEYMFDNNASRRKIYVPSASVEAYKSASGWSDYKSYIVGYDF